MSRAKDDQPASSNLTADTQAETIILEEGPDSLPVREEEQATPQPMPDPDWSKIGRLDRNSLDARWTFEKWSVIRELWRANYQMVTFFMKPEGGSLSLDEAIRKASEKLGEGPMLDKEMDRIAGWDVDSISWHTLDRVFRTKPSYAQQIWEEVKEQALNDFKSGHFAAAIFEGTDWQKDVWKRAHFVVIFQEMVEEYKPRGAIEMSMVEMVAVNYFLWQHWVGEHLQRARTEPRRESNDYQQWAKMKEEASYYIKGRRHTRKLEGHWTDGYWDIPYQSEAEAIEHALEMADRCRRAYHASVRSLRDWRRYNVPVIVQNAGQVNIAADGGQQVNVSSKKRVKKKPDSRKKKAATKTQPRQLASESHQESINVELVSEPTPVK